MLLAPLQNLLGHGIAAMPPQKLATVLRATAILGHSALGLCRGWKLGPILLVQVALPRKGDRIHTEEEDDAMDDDGAADDAEEGGSITAPQWLLSVLRYFL